MFGIVGQWAMDSGNCAKTMAESRVEPVGPCCFSVRFVGAPSRPPCCAEPPSKEHPIRRFFQEIQMRHAARVASLDVQCHFLGLPRSTSATPPQKRKTAPPPTTPKQLAMVPGSQEFPSSTESKSFSFFVLGRRGGDPLLGT